MRCVHDVHPKWLLEFVAANVDSLPYHWQERCLEIVAEAQMRECKRGANADGGNQDFPPR